MAELDTSQGGKKSKGKKRTKKSSTRVDLTPMVDLGFLLVTFFMLTTTFSKPQTMEINMPVKDKTSTEKQEQDVKASQAMTIMLGDFNSVYYYTGTADTASAKKTDFSPDGIRKVLLNKNRTTKDLIVVIKPADNSNYKNVVDILDEMNICNISRYALVDITPADLNLIKNYKEE